MLRTIYVSLGHHGDYHRHWEQVAARRQPAAV